MKQLTKRDRGGNALLNCEDCDEKGRGHCGTIPCRNQLVQRLADFEEFGLEPADFKNILEEFVDLKKTEADGRLVVLPCTEGTRLWYVWDGEIHDQHVVSVSFQDHIKPRFLVECVPFLRFYWDELIGKRVFLTREEAEAALMEGEQH